MFTGIVEEVGAVAETRPGGLTIRASKVMDGLKVGDSVSVSGACLTVTRRDGESFAVDAVPETLRRTNLGALSAGSLVNLERAVPVGGRLDGHVVQGHVDGTGEIESIRNDGQALMVEIRAAESVMRYVVEKGFVAVDGASLTVVECNEERFSVTIIPHTRERAIMGSWKAGDEVNIEVDILAKYVERLVAAGGRPSHGRPLWTY